MNPNPVRPASSVSSSATILAWVAVTCESPIRRSRRNCSRVTRNAVIRPVVIIPRLKYH